MKSIKQQYIDLQEGNMSQANFMRSLRMTMPQYITNVTSYQDSIKILKNKGILNEVVSPSELAMGIKVEMEHTDDIQVAKKIAMDHLAENPKYYSELKSSGIDTPQGISVKSTSGSPIKNLASTLSTSTETNLNKANPKDGFSLGFFEESLNEEENDTYKFGEKEYTGTGEMKKFSPQAILNSYFPNGVERPTTVTPGIVFQEVTEGEMSQTARTSKMVAGDTYVVKEEIDVKTINPISGAEKGTIKKWVCEKLAIKNKDKQPIKEAKDEKGRWTNADGKSMYAQFKEINNLNGQEVLIGIDYEMQKNEKLTKQEATKIVIKNLKKNPIYYTAEDMSGVEGYEIGYIGGKSAQPEAHQMQYLDKNMSNVVDKKRGMQPVKGVEKAKKDSDKGGETNKMEKGVELMSLIAKTVRGLKKMDATGEKMKKVSVKENKVASAVFGNKQQSGLSKLAQDVKDEDKEKSAKNKLKDKLKELIRRELKEITGAYGGDAMDAEDGSSYTN
jgi:hypothetical protein